MSIINSWPLLDFIREHGVPDLQEDDSAGLLRCSKLIFYQNNNETPIVVYIPEYTGLFTLEDVFNLRRNLQIIEFDNHTLIICKKETDLSSDAREEQTSNMQEESKKLETEDMKIAWGVSILFFVFALIWAFGSSDGSAIFLSFSVLLFSILAICCTVKNCKKCETNNHALRLFIYLVLCLLIEFLIMLIYFTTNLNDGERLEICTIFTLYLVIVRTPLIVYVYKQIEKPDTTFYLIPQWLKDFITKRFSSEVPIRAALVYIIYPLFYICTLPAGLLGWFYLIPASIIFAIVLLTIWVFRGMDKSNNIEEK